jgi:hypothetical protein|nr:MAG TPA: intron associated endonuclease [Caudoviricetes sp.]
MDKNKKYFVYAHENKFNGKVYIGITGQDRPEQRWQNGSGYKRTYFYNAIQKYGWDGFEHKILFSGITKEQAFDIEKRLIKELHSNEREYGYNIAEGGEYPGEYAIRGLKKASENRCVPVVRLNDGKIYSSVAAAQKDNNVPNENICKVCRNIRNTAGFMPGTKDPIFWSYYFEHMNIKQELKNRKNIKYLSKYKNTNKVACITTGEIFLSITDAEEKYQDSGVYVENIIKCCKGKYDYSGIIQEYIPLRWAYYWDYVKMSAEEKERLKHKPITNTVQCVEDNKIFRSHEQAARYYGINNTVSIRQQLNGRVKNIYVNNRTKKIHFRELKELNIK